MTVEPDGMGQRLRAVRKLHDLTQEELAVQAGVSKSLVSKVESGSKPGTWDLAIAVARALRVDAGALMGDNAASGTEPTGRIAAAVPAIRRALATYDCPPDLVMPARPLRQLADEVDAACRMRLDAKYVVLAESIPGLLTELSAVAAGLAGREREQAHWLLAAAYRCADAVVHKVGHLDLSASAIDRIVWAAQRCGDDLMVGTAMYVRAEIFFDTGAIASGLRLIGEAAEPLAARAASDLRAASVYGALHARAAVLAAKNGDAQTARTHLAIAGAAASVMGEDREYYYTSFGPSNHRIHEVAAMVELGDGAAALAAARGWVPPAGMPAERASHHFIDLARAQVWERDFTGAVASLLTARRIAPQHTRAHPYAKACVETVLQRAPRRPAAALGLATWLGIPV
ncbi:MAG TPA: helix-turn-helix transcriptional regulator [Actinocrinis sp.]|nr:helix-turn-helix transcriptional regulator [Actinocrinis sp.]